MLKNKKTIIFVIFLIVFFIFINAKRRLDIEVKTFQGENGWGYDIFIDGTQYIHQPNISALPGDRGFDSEAEAKAVAELMVKKIRDNILPPGVTEEEVNAILSK